MNKKTILILFLVLTLFIQGCSSGASAAVPAGSGTEMTPAKVSEAFYQWYLTYIGDPASESFKNPLSDKAYHQSEYLTQSFKDHVDEILAGFTGAGYDPFLCAQAVPGEIKADVAHVRDGTATVLMRTDFINHVFTVDLFYRGNRWQIGNIACDFTPEGTAKAFYTWYLGTIGDPGSDEMHNPMVEGTYRESGFLSPDFIQRLDELMANALPADPILLAQDIPQDFTVDPGAEEGIAIVHLQFGEDSVRHLKVSLISDLGNWLIDDITLAE
jgi:hypothetical protein